MMTAFRPRRAPRRSLNRGSALVLTILVILVLTIVGIAVAYFTQVEDKMSANDRLLKTALYAADTGLRAGEYILGQASTTTSIDSIINDTRGGAAITLPGPKTATPLFYNGQAYLNVLVPAPAGSRDVVRYSIYVRNNDEDPGGPSHNTDTRLNLDVVGQVILQGVGGAADTILATKILEEQVHFGKLGVQVPSQADQNEGATNAGAVGVQQ